MEIIFTDFRYRRPLIPLDKNKVDTIFIHHPAWENGTPQQIHDDVLNDPRKTNWNGFPYNEYITKDEKVYIGRGDNIGAHVHNYNSKSYGICVQGNYDIEVAPSDSLLGVVAERVIEAQRRFPNAVNIQPHSIRGGTVCPGKNFPMEKLYKMVKEIKNKNSIVDKFHWGETIYNNLADEFGIVFNEKRFDDKTSRAESMTMLLRGLIAMKEYIDNK